jgi:hypothetical protein
MEYQWKVHHCTARFDLLAAILPLVPNHSLLWTEQRSQVSILDLCRFWYQKQKQHKTTHIFLYTVCNEQIKHLSKVYGSKTWQCVYVGAHKYMVEVNLLLCYKDLMTQVIIHVYYVADSNVCGDVTRDIFQCQMVVKQVSISHCGWNVMIPRSWHCIMYQHMGAPLKQMQVSWNASWCMVLSLV